MFEHFRFLIGDVTLGQELLANYSYPLVALSILVAIFASYTAFLVSSRLEITQKGPARIIWLTFGAISLGVGIWAMHFVGMLAYQLPIKINYDQITSIISIIPAILGSLVVLKTTHANYSAGKPIVFQSLMMGFSIGLMHYLGMTAMRLEGDMYYEPFMFSLSIIVAILLADAALRLKIWADVQRANHRSFSPRLILAAIVMGIAISGMHYTGMTALHIYENPYCQVDPISWTSDALARLIAVVTFSLGLLLIAAVEISHRKDLYREMKAANEKQRVILNTVANAVITIDSKGNIVQFNPAAEKMFGYHEEEVIDKDVSILLPEEEWVMHQYYINNSNLHAQRIISQNRELQGRRKDGSLIDIDLHVAPFTIKGSKGFVGTIRDITEQKRLQHEIIQHRDHLEEQVNERTQEIIQANEAKSTFLSNMSHELRTPMHSILSFTSLALKKAEDEKQISFLEKVRISGQRLTSLLDDLLDLAKLESGKMPIDLQQVDLMELVKQAVAEMSSLFNDKKITVNFDTQKTILCSIDKKLITQVIINFLSNAMKFSPSNSQIDIQVSIEKYLPNSPHMELATLSIIDQGVGIPNDEIDAVFDKFVQSSKTRTQAGGTGLGLPISKEIIEKHFGSIWAESPPEGKDKGSSFNFVIPVKPLNEIAPKTVIDAYHSHTEWLSRIDEYFTTKSIPGNISSSLIANTHLCSMGQWLNRQNQNNLDIERLIKEHQQFHQTAAECVAFFKVNDFDNAYKKRQDLHAQSDHVKHLMKKLIPEAH